MTAGRGCRAAHEVIRRHVDFLEVDRPLHADHTAMQKLVGSGEILAAVEAAVGPLAPPDEAPPAPHPVH
jgi:histidine ammonia-lyase